MCKLQNSGNAYIPPILIRIAHGELQMKYQSKILARHFGAMHLQEDENSGSVRL